MMPYSLKKIQRISQIMFHTERIFRIFFIFWKLIQNDAVIVTYLSNDPSIIIIIIIII